MQCLCNAINDVPSNIMHLFCIYNAYICIYCLGQYSVLPLSDAGGTVPCLVWLGIYFQEEYPTWGVDLGEKYLVDRVYILNRALVREYTRRWVDVDIGPYSISIWVDWMWKCCWFIAKWIWEIRYLWYSILLWLHVIPSVCMTFITVISL